MSKPEEINFLLAKFHFGEMPLDGPIAVWDDFIGRPMDNIYHLKKIFFAEDSNILELVFDSDIIRIKKPSGIKITDEGLAISYAHQVERENTNHLIRYTLEENKIVAENIKGQKTVHADSSKPAFMLWGGW